MSTETVDTVHPPLTQEELEAGRLALQSANHLINFEKAKQKACGTGCIVGRNRDTGKVYIIPACCKKWTCPRCAPKLSRTWAKKAAAAAPERFFTMTADPKLSTDPEDAKQKMRAAFQRFVEFWRKGRKKSPGKIPISPHVFEYMAVWELQRNGMPHLHVLQKGDYVPHEFLKQWMIRARVGSIDDIRRIRSGPAAARYVTKYTHKTAGQTKDAFPGDRLIMCSRHFFPKAKEPDDLEKVPEIDWCFTPKAAAEVIDIIVRGMKYLITDECFPFQIELQPTDQDLPLDAIEFYINPQKDDP